MPPASTMHRRFLVALFFLAFGSHGLAANSGTSFAATRAGTIAIDVDATDVEHRVFKVRERIPVKPGPLKLLYPQWIQGNHAPTGKPWLVAGLHVFAAGRELRWLRQGDDPFAFDVDVPAGVSEVQVDFQYLSAHQATQGPLVVSPELLTMAWNYVVLYPAGFRADGIRMQASFRAPPGWEVASPLAVEGRAGETISFAPVSLATLVDSPVWAGKYLKRIALDAETRVSLDAFADMPEHLPADEAHLAPFRTMLSQAHAVLGPAPYRRYELLLALHDQIHPHGLEHQSATEIEAPAAFFSRWKSFAYRRGVFPHELVHAWIGKKHRPAGLAVPHFNVPLRTDLLWVYEGETDYWGWVLNARSGFVTAEEARAGLAASVALFASRAGRSWRDLQDTTNDPVIRSERARDWPSWQRGYDYYGEAGFLWLEADARIRERTGGQKSLDDFARAFHGGALQREGVVTYTFDDVVQGLQAVVPGDWRAFLRERLDSHERDTASAALAAAGWRVVFRDKAAEILEASDRENGRTDFTYSLGFTVGRQDVIANVQWDGPAFRAGLAANATLVAVNGRAYKAELLKLVVESAKASRAPIALLVKSGELYRTVEIDYHEGLRYPHLERLEGTEDRLSDILRAR